MGFVPVCPKRYEDFGHARPGSASSLVACRRIGGLDYVGFEINEKYYTAANRRLEEEKAQMRLFDLLEEQEKAAQTTLF